jgi:hypothetical protein
MFDRGLQAGLDICISQPARSYTAEMALPETLQIALKEWASVCQALETGQQMLLLRKGGIYESGGEFELENRHFLLFPTYLHQNLNMLKPEAHASFEPRSSEPEQIRISAAGEVTDIVQLKSRPAMDALDAEHVWTPPLIDMRFNYKPQNPLYLMLVRTSRLAEAIIVENTPDYAGCKSWVPLGAAVDVSNTTPVLSDELYQQRRQRILGALTGEVF